MNPNYNNNYNQNYNNYNQNFNNYNQQNSNNYNNYQRQGFPNQGQNYQQNIKTNNNNIPQNQKINNPQNKQLPQNQQNQNINNKPVINQYQEKLRIAYNIFSAGVKDYKSYSLEMALQKFEQANKMIKEAYPYIQNNPNLKETTDKFQRQVTHYLETTQYQIQHRFDYKSTAGYADVDYKKKQNEEIARMVREAEEPAKTQNYYFPQNNNINNNQQNNNNNYNNNKATNINNVNVNNNKTNPQKKDDKSIVTNDLRDKILAEIV